MAEPRRYNIPITRPLFGPEEMAAVQQPLESGWVVQGPFVKEFEGRFAAYTKASHALATTSCTTALHLAVAALGLGPGDEVIVPAFTWVSTANVVEYMGATPIFCDVTLDSFNVDVAQLESKITPRTVGIIPVHLFGLCADMGPIMDVAARHALWVVEDAACAFGAWYHDQHAGTFGAAGCFSFHPRKAITTGEGGMVTTQDAALARLVSSLRDHGASRSDHARHHQQAAFLLAEYDHLGYNYRMTDLQGALGVAQMARADTILAARRRLAAVYDAELAALPWLKPPQVPSGYLHGYQAYVALFCPEAPSLSNSARLYEQRNRLMMVLEEQGIATRQGTHAPVTLGYYQRRYNLALEEFPNAVMAERLTLALPLFPQMSEAEQQIVITALDQAWSAQ